MKESTTLRSDVNKQEKLIVETTAQMKMNDQKIEGRLILTGKRLIFIRNFSLIETEIPLSQVMSVKVSKIWWFFNKGIELSFESKMLIFLVEYPMDWLKLINQQLYSQVE